MIQDHLRSGKGRHHVIPSLITLIVSVILFSLFSCALRNNAHTRSQKLPELKTILVFPFQNMAGVYGENTHIMCPVCGHVFVTGKTEENACGLITDRVVELLVSNPTLNLTLYNKTDTILLKQLTENTISGNQRLAEEAHAVNADAILTGHVYRFRERTGNQFSVSSAASVAFDIHLMSVTDGSIVWSGMFDETQLSLSENFLQLGTFFKRKGRWVTAMELADGGLEEILKEFNKQ